VLGAVGWEEKKGAEKNPEKDREENFRPVTTGTEQL